MAVPPLLGKPVRGGFVQSINIVELIGATVPLKKRGQEHWGLCPFHNEKTPSLSVNRAKNLFYCRGCGVGGDAIEWVRKTKRLSYAEAVKLLGSDLAPRVTARQRAEQDRREVERINAADRRVRLLRAVDRHCGLDAADQAEAAGADLASVISWVRDWRDWLKARR